MSNYQREETLDPENWDNLRALGHQMLDDMVTRLETIRDHKFRWLSRGRTRPLPIYKITKETNLLSCNKYIEFLAV